MKIRKFKRYTTWEDETMWKKSSRDSGLAYGVYDHATNTKVNVGNCTTYSEAHKAAEKLNSELDDPFLY